MTIICSNCGKEDINHAKGLCLNCYRKYAWKRKLIICKRCGREKPNHAKGFCGGCYQFVFHLDQNKAWNKKKNFELDFKEYKDLTKECIICGFDKIVDLHHLDENKKNNSKQNLIGLCPNHHKMLHDFKFRKEIREILTNKGISLPKDEKIDFKLE
jgi:ribosomal protein L37E